jgi:hypothetical protein
VPARAHAGLPVCHQEELSFGRVRVFYPESEGRRCTAALLLEVDPIGLVRGGGAKLDQYVNYRPTSPPA